MNEHKYIHLDHAEDALYCGPIKTAIGVLLIGALLVVPTALIFHRLGYHDGVTAGTNRVQAAIDESVLSGTPFAFVDGDVKLVITVKTDSAAFRKNIKKMADKYELVRYRVSQEYGPDDSKETTF